MAIFYKDILSKIQNENFFQNFKFIKKDISFRQKTEFGLYKVEFYLHNNSYDLGRQTEALEVFPVYGVRFDILSKWFEKFSFKTISDQRNNCNIMIDGSMLNKDKVFYFLNTKNEFENEYSNFKKSVIEICSNYFSKYKSLNDYYEIEIIPVLNGNSKMNDVGADWIFEYLTAVKLCDFSRFDEMITILKRQIDFMNSRGEPNIAMYNEKFDQIFQYLRNVSLS